MQIKPGCIVVVVIGRFSIAGSFAPRPGPRARLGPQRTSTAEQTAPVMPRTDRAAAPRPRPKTRRTIAEDPKRYLVVRIIFPASMRARPPQYGAGRLTAPRSAIDRSDPDKETYVFFENVRQRRAGYKPMRWGSSHRVSTSSTRFNTHCFAQPLLA